MQKIKILILLSLVATFVLIVYLYIQFFYILDIDGSVPNIGDWRNAIYPNIQRLISGDLAVFKSMTPTFYLLMVPVSWINIEYLSVIIASLVFAAILLFVYKQESFYASLIVGLSLLSSFIFLIYSISPSPTLFDVMLFLVTSYFFFKKKNLVASVFLLELMYNHSMNIFWFFILAVYSLAYRRDYIKYLCVVFVLSLPVLYMFTSQAVIAGINSLTRDGFISSGPDHVLKMLFYNYNWSFIRATGITIWLLFPVSLLFLLKFRKWKREQLFYLIWALSFLPMMVLAFLFMYDPIRWTFLFIVPLAILESSIIAEEIS